MGLLGRARTAVVGETDRRVVVLALARMVGAMGNSFLIVVLPLFIASGEVDLSGLVDTTVDLGGLLGQSGGASGTLALTLTEPLLIGLVLSLFGFVNSLAQPFTGRLSDRTGRRKLLILVGIAVLGSASAAYAVVNTYPAVLVLRALQGLGLGVAIPSTVALVNEYSAQGDRGGSFGVFNTFRLLGFGLGPVLAGAVVQFGPYGLPGGGTLSGFDAAFGVAALAAAGSFVLVSLYVSQPERVEVAASDDIAVSLTGDGRLLDPVFTLGLATVALAITVTLFATLQPQVNARLDQREVFFAAQFGAVVVANVLFQIPVGRLSDRYGRKPFLVGGFVVLTPAVLAQGLVTDPWLMLLARLLHGISVAAVFAPSLALAGDLARAGSSGSTLSVLTMGFGIGAAVGPLASGFLVSFGFVWPFAVGAVLSVAGLVLVITQVQEPTPPQPTPAPSPQD
jgi:MFS family permease